MSKGFWPMTPVQNSFSRDELFPNGGHTELRMQGTSLDTEPTLVQLFAAAAASLVTALAILPAVLVSGQLPTYFPEMSP